MDMDKETYPHPVLYQRIMEQVEEPMWRQGRWQRWHSSDEELQGNEVDSADGDTWGVSEEGVSPGVLEEELQHLEEEQVDQSNQDIRVRSFDDCLVESGRSRTFESGRAALIGHDGNESAQLTDDHQRQGAAKKAQLESQSEDKEKDERPARMLDPFHRTQLCHSA